MAFVTGVAEFTPIVRHECVSSHSGFFRVRVEVWFILPSPSPRPSLICEPHNGMCLDRDSLRHEGDRP
jgi:hypothetical protein